MIPRRWYERKSFVNFEEDEYHEFKGHRNLSIEELPPWCFQPRSEKRSRKAASRAINAFLNSGRGGTVYLGIIDEGVVKGLHLTEFQKDHVLVSLKDLFSRYKPPVPEDKYEVSFVPIFGQDEERNFQQLEKNLQRLSVDEHLKPHLLRTFDFCWCDQDLAQKVDKGQIPRDYIIEIKILPQKNAFKLFNNGEFKAVLPHIYSNEEDKCFFRKSASCVEYSLDSIRELTIQQVSDIYTPIIESLRHELKTLLEIIENDLR